MIVSPQYEQTLVALSWSALWLRRILFFDFDVFRFGCAIGHLLTIFVVLRVAVLKFATQFDGFSYLPAFLTESKTG